MKSVIPSKFQTTIPKPVREKLKLAVNDALEWRIVKGQMVVYPLQRRFLKRRNTISRQPRRRALWKTQSRPRRDEQPMFKRRVPQTHGLRCRFSMP